MRYSINLTRDLSVFFSECFVIYKSLGYSLLLQKKKKTNFKGLQTSYHKIHNNHPLIYDVLGLITLNRQMGKILEFIHICSHQKVLNYQDRADEYTKKRRRRNLPQITFTIFFLHLRVSRNVNKKFHGFSKLYKKLTHQAQHIKLFL